MNYIRNLPIAELLSHLNPTYPLILNVVWSLGRSGVRWIDPPIIYSNNIFTIKSLQTIISRFINNGYPPTFLKQCILFYISRHINNNNNTDTNTQLNTNKFIYIKTPYINDIFHRKLIYFIKRLNLSNKIKLYYTTNSLQKIFSPPKFNLLCKDNCKICRVCESPNICFSKNLVYIVTCKLCTLCYVGQTSRFLKNRINEHFTKKDSAVFTHHQTHHSNTDIYDIFSCNILHKNLNFLNKRLHVESIYISMHADKLMNGCITTLSVSVDI